MWRCASAREHHPVIDTPACQQRLPTFGVAVADPVEVRHGAERACHLREKGGTFLWRNATHKCRCEHGPRVVRERHCGKVDAVGDDGAP